MKVMHKSYRWKMDRQKKSNKCKCFPFHEDMYDIWHYEKKKKTLTKQNSLLKYIRSSARRDLKQSIQENQYTWTYTVHAPVPFQMKYEEQCQPRTSVFFMFSPPFIVPTYPFCICLQVQKAIVATLRDAITYAILHFPLPENKVK